MAGAWLPDKRNGFSIAPRLTLGAVINAIPRPWWWVDFLTTPKLEFASLTSTGGTVGELLDAAMNPTTSLDDLKVIRQLWPGKIVIKGVQSVEDAGKLVDLGVAGVVLSNHGGRQLDRASIPFHLLPEVVRELGAHVEIAVDTGIMNDADIDQLTRTMKLLDAHSIAELEPAHVTQLRKLVPITSASELVERAR